MKLTLRTISGATFTLDAEPATTVGALKDAVEAAQGAAFPKAQLKLVYKGKVLDDDAKALGDYEVSEAGFLVVFVQKAAAAKPAPAAAEAPKPAAAEAAPMQVDAPAAPAAGAAGASGAAAAAEGAAAAQPAAAAAGGEQAAAAAAEPADPYAAAASHLLAGPALEQAVSNIVDMGFPRDDVMRAMRAAFNNPERAVEYLMTGLPPGAAAAAAPPAAAAGGAGGASGGGGAAGAGAAAAAGGGGGAPAAPGGPALAQPLDMFGGGGGGAAGGAGGAAGGAEGGEGGAAAGAGPLDFLRGNPQFQLLRRAVQANPDILAPMLQELRKQNPGLMQQISQHQAEFMRMVMEEPGDGDEDDELQHMAQLLGAMGGGPGGAGGAGGGGPGGLPPGVVQIELSEADDAAIQRLQGLGFDRDAAIEAYLACDRNEEVAANFLLEGGFGE